MRQRMMEFLVKRLCNRISYLKNVNLDDTEALEMILDDIDTYTNEIVNIAKELLIP